VGWARFCVILVNIWAGAPFSNKAALVTRVQSTVDAWVSAGRLTQANGQQVVTTAQNATYVP